MICSLNWVQRVTELGLALQQDTNLISSVVHVANGKTTVDYDALADVIDACVVITADFLETHPGVLKKAEEDNIRDMLSLIDGKDVVKSCDHEELEEWALTLHQRHMMWNMDLSPAQWQNRIRSSTRSTRKPPQQ